MNLENCMAIKISYIPVSGMITNYDDCEAIAPDGSRWESVSNRWVKIGDSPTKVPENYVNPIAPAFGALGFSISMAVFAKPAAMTFPDPAVWLSVLFAISCVSAFAFYRMAR